MEKKEKTKIIGKFCYPFKDDEVLGTVYKGYETNNRNNVVAIKFASKELYRKYLKYFRYEIAILKKFKGHPGFLEYQQVYLSDNNLYIITTFCNDGNLKDRIVKGSQLSIEESLSILYQITKVFIARENFRLQSYTRSNESIITIHGDIKPENILFHNGKVVLSDWGFAKLVAKETEEESKQNDIVYMSPQLIGNQIDIHKCDIWAMGIITYEMIFGYVPWGGSTALEVIYNIRNFPLLEFPKDKKVPDDIKDLLTNMLQYKEELRLDWIGILRHPAFKIISVLVEFPVHYFGIHYLATVKVEQNFNISDIKNEIQKEFHLPTKRFNLSQKDKYTFLIQITDMIKLPKYDEYDLLSYDIILNESEEINKGPYTMLIKKNSKVLLLKSQFSRLISENNLNNIKVFHNGNLLHDEQILSDNATLYKSNQLTKQKIVYSSFHKNVVDDDDDKTQEPGVFNLLQLQIFLTTKKTLATNPKHYQDEQCLRFLQENIEKLLKQQN